MAVPNLELRPLGNTGLKLSSVGFGASPFDNLFRPVSESEAFRLGINFFDTSPVPPATIDVILSYCHYSINDSTLEDLLPYLKTKGVGIISAAPLAMGLLTELGPPEPHPASPELKSACQAAAVYCKEKGKNISKLALQYNLSNKDISSVLVGMDSVKQMEENIAAATELALFGKDWETLAKVEAILKPVKNQTWPSGIPRR
ncbi:L-galactose dehydrogenase [Hibiscus trionum]|uniref:L-galactose dehydrogenase n=1 Tax=Hibiscus trionum TaxID=183268 RepID=A0A9W7LQS7_HIBTR|nr:L-galactose dehydrogenase [Hibiscus trionum]